MTIEIEAVSGATYAANNRLPMVLFDSVLTRGTLTASSEATDGAGSNAVNGHTNDYWTPTAMPATLTTVLGSSEACDSAAIVGHTCGTDGATVIIEYWDGSAWQTASSVTPTDDTPILCIFGEETAAQWRVRLTGSTAPSIAVAMIGSRLLIPGGVTPSYTPLYNAKDVELMNNRSRKGHLIGNRVKRRGASGQVNFVPVLTSWVDANLTAFNEHYDDGEPFVFASAPSVFAKDLVYCWRQNRTLQPSFSESGELMRLSMQVDCYVE